MDTSKIIRGVVSSGRYTVTAPIVKEDYGLYLKIEGVELPSTYEVDFSNSESSGTSVTMIGNSDGVLIPHQFIETGKDVFAFLYHVGDNYGRTVFKFRIPNKLRPDRTDDEPTPEEQSTIGQAISALNTAVEQTAQDVIDADASAQSASQSAESAEQSAQTSRGWAESAEDYAQSAEQSELQASASATASAQSAEQSAINSADAQDSAEEAQGYAQASAQSASASANSASQAQGYANNASASAQSASQSASGASASAQTASAKAQDASTSAQTASQKATESAQSASQALTYKTDAESAKTASQTAQGLAEQARDSAISAKTDAESAKADAESARDEAQTIVDGISGALDDKADVITDTASGAVASFTDGADGLPLKSLVVNIDPVQDLSQGDPSPENICPISGWTQVDVEQSGKNLLPPGDDVDITINGIRFTSDGNGTYTISGMATQNASYTFSIPQIYLPQTVYEHIGNNVVNSGVAVVYLSGSTQLSAPSANAVNRIVDVSSAMGGKSVDNIRLYVANGTSVDMTLSPMLMLDNTATPYEPYTGRSLTIDLGQTVYGGHLDVLSGVLRVDRAMATFDGSSDESWLYYSIATGNLFRTGLNDRKQGGINSSLPYIELYKCNAYKVAVNSVNRSNGTFSGSLKNVDFVNNEYSTLAEWRQYLSENNVQFVYPLAEPIEIQLTPNEVNSLLGVNNIFADTGDSEVVYRADTELWVQRKITEAVATVLNS